MIITQQLFDNTCQLAKSQKALELFALLDEHLLTIDFYFNLHTPIMRLAEDGEVEAVNFLLDSFQADSESALEGYARGGHYPQVNQLLKNKANRVGLAIRGAAYKKDKDYVTALMVDKRPYAVMPYAIMGYAQSGCVEEVNNLLIKTNGRWSDLAATGYGIGNHGEQTFSAWAPEETSYVQRDNIATD